MSGVSSILLRVLNVKSARRPRTLLLGHAEPLAQIDDLIGQHGGYAVHTAGQAADGTTSNRASPPHRGQYGVLRKTRQSPNFLG